MSRYFQSSSDLYRVFDAFFSRLRDHAEIGPAIRALGVNFKFVVADPEAEINVDNLTPGGRIIMGAAADVPDGVVMRMTADVGHRFWLGRVNLMQAIGSGEMKIEKGSPSILIKLLPVIKPAYAIYADVLRELGLARMLE